MPDWHVIGPQKYRTEGDLVSWDLTGSVSVPEAARIFDTCLDVQKAYGYLLLLIVIRGTWSFLPETRKFLAEFHRNHTAVGATAIVGSSLTMMMLIDMVVALQVKLDFFKSPRLNGRARLSSQ